MSVASEEREPVKTELREVLPEEREILLGLLEKYLYELSQYDGSAFGGDGLFGYPYLSSYWDEGARHAYFILADGALAGFALVNRHPACPCPLDWAVAEFFVAYPYRGQGVGSEAMRRLTALHKGRWQVKYHPGNVAGAAFWRRTAGELSPGGVWEERESPEHYPDGTPGRVLLFATGE